LKEKNHTVPCYAVYLFRTILFLHQYETRLNSCTIWCNEIYELDEWGVFMEEARIFLFSFISRMDLSPT